MVAELVKNGERSLVEGVKFRSWKRRKKRKGKSQEEATAELKRLIPP